MTSLSLLWHFHQPDYRDPHTSRPVLPWVRHHALRGYRDLAVAVVESGVAMTVNLVPTLIEQLAWYADGGSDPWLDRVARPAEALSPADRAGLLREGFAGHPAMVEAAAPWRALQSRVRERGALDVQDLRDLQVWSVLGWTGWTARRDHALLGQLVQQGVGFTEADKQGLLGIQAAVCAELPALWRALPEVSASPWGHPILPLLVDANHGRRCLPELPPQDFAWPGDAALQLARGRDQVAALWGRPVTGLWPSEGAVSPEVVALAAEAGFGWLVSDEGVLERSERRGSGQGPWQLADGLVGFFRHRGLSDLVGFRTAGRDPAEAVDALLRGVAEQDGHVTLALDGENPWESHADAGEGFLDCLLGRLSDHPQVRATDFATASAEPVGHVARVFTGGWINADFAIWIGDADDQAAWGLLSVTRAAVAAAGDPADALQAVLAAEGSDWFWWYGPEFQSDQDDTFDRLFRGHLLAAWRALGRTPPDGLLQPIGRRATQSRDRAPIGPITPAGPLGWWGAGCWDGRRSGGAMAPGVRWLDHVLWGADPDAAHLRLVAVSPLPPLPGGRWEIRLTGLGEDVCVAFDHQRLAAGAVHVRLPTSQTGEGRVELRLRCGREDLGCVGPAGGLPVTVGRAQAGWRGGWV